MSETDLREPFLSEEMKVKQVGYGIPCVDLINMFDGPNILSGKSLKDLKQMGIPDLLKKLNTDEVNGINAREKAELDEREKVYGHNRPPPIKGKTLCDLVLEQLEDKILIILMVAALFSLTIGIWKEGWETGWIEGCTIWIAVIIVVTVAAGNNYIKEKQFRALMAQRNQRDCTVRRNGKVATLSVHDLLVGDIIQIDTGENMPVDAIILTGSNLRADESSETGEPDTMPKSPLKEEMDDATPFLLSGTLIVDGKGMAVVTCTGDNSRLGKSRAILGIKEEEGTPLELKLEKIADLIGVFGMWAAVITFMALVGNLLIKDWLTGTPILTMETLKICITYLILGITIIVVAVPEGLPLAVTIALAYSVGKMKDQNNLVRKLASCETMGGANNICTDKTGTLTKNEMTVMACYAEETKYAGEKEMLEINRKLDAKTVEVFCIGVCHNSSANLIHDEETGKLKNKGSATECALLRLSDGLGYNYEKYRDSKAFSIPFSSRRKRMTSAMPIPEKGIVRIFCKGASEIVLKRCSMFIGKGGVEKKFTQKQKDDIEKNVITKYAQEAMRTVTLAYRDIPIGEFDRESLEKANDPLIYDTIEEKLTFIGLVGIVDPIREDVRDAVKKCHEAGITVRMVTGDNLETAMAIARNAGILDDETAKGQFACMTGPDFKSKVGGVKKNPEDKDKPIEEQREVIIKPQVFDMVTQDLRVMARSSPEDKYVLVTGLRNNDNVVAVTGDGTNDAPALKKANVGFAMGIAGTEVAKEAADIILMDDNFSSIVTATKWGRNIYGSIRKFLQFQLTVNVVAIFMVFIGGVVLGESPLTSVQMLWVNLIMDTFASLALATEPPTDALLKDPPHGKNDFIISDSMWRNILCQSLYQIAVLCVLLFYGPTLFGWKTKKPMDIWTKENGLHFTMVFHTFVFMQVFNEINARKIKSKEYNVFANFFNNYLFFVIEIFTIAMQMALVQFGGLAIKCAPLTLYQHLMCIGIGFFSIPFGLIFKFVPESWFDFGLHKKEHAYEDHDAARRSTRAKLRRTSTLTTKAKAVAKFKGLLKPKEAHEMGALH